MILAELKNRKNMLEKDNYSSRVCTANQIIKTTT